MMKLVVKNLIIMMVYVLIGIYNYKTAINLDDMLDFVLLSMFGIPAWMVIISEEIKELKRK